MKEVVWLANTRRTIKSFPPEAAEAIGKNLYNVQCGLPPIDWRPLFEIGSGVIEIRVHRPHEYRCLYVAKFIEAVYVLHVFEKKTEKTLLQDIATARTRYAKLQKERQTAEKKKGRNKNV